MSNNVKKIISEGIDENGFSETINNIKFLYETLENKGKKINKRDNTLKESLYNFLESFTILNNQIKTEKQTDNEIDISELISNHYKY